MRKAQQRKALYILATAMVAVWSGTYHFVLGGGLHTSFGLAYWLFGDAVIVFYMVAFTKGRQFTHLPVAPGRVAAIVPSYEEADPEAVHKTVRALLSQTRPPDHIFVQDDGSVDHPVVPFEHPKVSWGWAPNGGKRVAQGHVLKKLRRDDWDFVFTVDSDAEPEPDALEQLLRAMSNPKVQAATGLILVRNREANLLTRLTDLNIGTSCLMIRTSRSAIGAVETTSGALALYRSAILFDNLHDYLSSGTNGDDRRLTMYSLLRGDVVVVNEAVVHTDMPTTVRGMFRQRLRWGKSGWQALPFCLTNLKGKQLFFPLLAFVQWSVMPVVLLWIFCSVMWAGQGKHAILAFLAYMVIRYGETSLYLAMRPGLSARRKLWAWVLYTPLESLLNLTVTRPAKYWALLKLKDRGWVTRGNAHAQTGKHRKTALAGESKSAIPA
ncbi:glycosyltransferase family 2 protein [Streptomyces sp. NPDC001848]|uniref:glycosyltransferase family 2 protein n=1 Tax=Streptomyces sp. NPDC001848 TaxID=3364618 RepID=UPI0036A24704